MQRTRTHYSNTGLLVETKKKKQQKNRRTWTDVLQLQKDYRCQSILLYPEKLLIIIEG